MDMQKIGSIGITVSGNHSRVAESYAEMFGSADNWQARLQTLASGMYRHGFLISEGHVGVTAISAEEITECKINRASFIAQVAKTPWVIKTGDSESPEVKLAGEVVAEAYRQAWDTEPVVAGVYGNLRTIAAVLASAARQSKGLSTIAEIPIDDLGPLSQDDRIVLCVNENTQKGIGTVPLSDQDRVHAAMQMCRLPRPGQQALLRKTFKDGTGQKLWEILQANKVVPDLCTRLLDRKNQALWDSLTASKLRPLNASISTAPTEETKAEAVTALVSYVNAPDQKVAPLRANQECVKTLIESDVTIIKDAITAITTNNLALLDKYHLRAKALNAAVRECLKSKSEPVAPVAPVDAKSKGGVTGNAAKKR